MKKFFTLPILTFLISCGPQVPELEASFNSAFTRDADRPETDRIIIVETDGKFKEADWPGPKSTDQKVLPMRFEELILSRANSELQASDKKSEINAAVGAVAGLLELIRNDRLKGVYIAGAVGIDNGPENYIRIVREISANNEELVRFVAADIFLAQSRFNAASLALSLAYNRSVISRFEIASSVGDVKIDAVQDERFRVAYLLSKAEGLELYLQSELEFWSFVLQLDRGIRRDGSVSRSVREMRSAIFSINRMVQKLTEDDGGIDTLLQYR